MKRNKKFIITSIFVIFLFLFASISITSDSRWKGFIETAQFALKFDLSKGWTNHKQVSSNYPAPINIPQGTAIDSSAYERIIMFLEGLKVLEQYPLGYGFDRGAWGEGVSKVIEVRRSGHSHSGLLDWTISLGYPGLILWIMFIVYLIQYAVKTWVNKPNPFSLYLGLLVSGFFIRSIVDSNIRDFPFEIFMTTAGLLYFQHLPSINKSNPN